MRLLLVLGLAGCGGRVIPAATDAAPPPQVDGQASPELPPTTAPVIQCVVALQLNTCCPSPRPVTVAALAEDPCLVPYPYHAAPPPECRPDASCAGIACDWDPPPTRLARGLPDGTCTWKSECQTDGDCTMALAWSICGCDCVQAVPKTLLDPGRCLTEPQAGPPAVDGCSPTCDARGLPCSSGCLATNWIRAFCDTSKVDGAYRICNLAGSK